MEKITYPPLVAHLQAQREFYNSLYGDAELKYGIISKPLLQQWIVGSIEPVIREAVKKNSDQLPALFKAFYTELLRLAGNGLLLTQEKEHAALWAMCRQLSSFIGTHPTKVLTALHQALQTIHRYQSSKALAWIDLMNKTVSACKSLDDLLACGRMNAWFCGLAQLREKCRDAFHGLSSELKNALQKHCPLPFEEIMASAWVNQDSPQFKNVQGGFAGFGGGFSAPPLLTDAGAYVLAGDNEHRYLVFADEFGQVLLPIASAQMMANPDSKSLKELRKKLGDKLAAYDDISSCVVKANTVFLTRYSSHHIYTYALPYDN